MLFGARLHVYAAALVEGWWEEGLLKLALWMGKKHSTEVSVRRKSTHQWLMQPSVIGFACLHWIFGGPEERNKSLCASLI